MATVRDITVTFPFTSDNMQKLGLLQTEIKGATLWPSDNAIELNQVWIDGEGQQVKIKYLISHTIPIMWCGEFITRLGTVMHEYYDDNGMYIAHGSHGATDPLHRYNLSHMIIVNEPKPGEYWIDKQNNVWLLMEHIDAPLFLRAVGTDRTWYKGDGRYSREHIDDRDLVSRVFISSIPPAQGA
jgi:hypothetical protein